MLMWLVVDRLHCRPSPICAVWVVSVGVTAMGGRDFAVHRTTDALADAGENASKWRVKTK